MPTPLKYFIKALALLSFDGKILFKSIVNKSSKSLQKMCFYLQTKISESDDVKK